VLSDVLLEERLPGWWLHNNKGCDVNAKMMDGCKNRRLLSVLDKYFCLIFGLFTMKRVRIIAAKTLVTAGMAIVMSTAAKASIGSPCKTTIYHPDHDHLWNRVHEALFVRVDEDGRERGRDSVDPLLWPETSEFLLQGESHEEIITLLDEFIAKDGEKLIWDPLKRAVLQHDLWAVFDWTANVLNPLPFGGRVDPEIIATGELNAKRKALRQRLTIVIPRLALEKSVIANLTDNYTAAVKSGAFTSKLDLAHRSKQVQVRAFLLDSHFNPRFDPEHPPKHYLPTDLLEPHGSWVCIRGPLPGPSAPVHVEYYRGRSPFLVLLRLPDGRQATLDYLKQLNQASARESDAKKWKQQLPQFPVGTAVALVRLMMVVDQTGEIIPTPIVQTAQFRVYREVGSDVKNHEGSQAVYKYVMQRARLFSGKQGGLRAMTAHEHSGLSLIYNDDEFQVNGSKHNRQTVMQSCIDCHSCGGPTVHSIFTFRQDEWVPGARSLTHNNLRLLPTRIDLEFDRVKAWKTDRYDWGLLQGLLQARPTHN